ncbi:MAG: hypothetical protein KA746_15835 [Pyrinomonadaceae bacterium]|nr:hypothetical protein [Pyrinomonadaceae bacterium]MBP6213397.1 hypothetical protein [Pyrinomonadaceae bacterium]
MSFFKRKPGRSMNASVWARQGMNVTFRAEIMPGKPREERTFRIEKVMTNGRVVLENFLGEHREGAFEPINFLRERAGNDQRS